MICAECKKVIDESKGYKGVLTKEPGRRKPVMDMYCNEECMTGGSN